MPRRNLFAAAALQTRQTRQTRIKAVISTTENRIFPSLGITGEFPHSRSLSFPLNMFFTRNMIRREKDIEVLIACTTL